MSTNMWRRRGEAYALRLLQHGSSPRELLQSLTLASRERETANLAEVFETFADPARSSQRQEAERDFLDGAMSIAVAAGPGDRVRA
jgi:hypothetical protein